MTEAPDAGLHRYLGGEPEPKRKLDLSKTQFLITEYGYRPFRRRRRSAMFDKRGFVRLCDAASFRELSRAFPEPCAADGLHLRTIWTLEEIDG